MIKMLIEKDVNLALIKQKKVAIIWCGSQWHAHALNLQDSWVEVVVWLREASPTWEKAIWAWLKVMETSEAAKWGDVIMMLTPDTKTAQIYKESIKKHLKKWKSLVFAHWFNIHYKTIKPPKDVDVWLVAPKWPWHMVRQTYTKWFWVPCLFAVHQDATWNALEIAKSYAAWIWWARAGLIETTFKEETETDLFWEQTVLCWWVTQLIQQWFETLTEAWYKPEVAYFECLHELKLIVDLIYVGWISAMNYSISDTAEWWEYITWNKIIDSWVKKRMQKALKDIQNGKFARQWIKENKEWLPNFKKYRDEIIKHPIEKVWDELRDIMKIKDRLEWWWTKQFLAEDAKNQEYK